MAGNVPQENEQRVDQTDVSLRKRGSGTVTSLPTGVLEKVPHYCQNLGILLAYLVTVPKGKQTMERFNVSVRC